jgi:putative transposase
MAKVLGVSQPAVTQAVERGERYAAERGLSLGDLLEEEKHINLSASL